VAFTSGHQLSFNARDVTARPIVASAAVHECTIQPIVSAHDCALRTIVLYIYSVSQKNIPDIF